MKTAMNVLFAFASTALSATAFAGPPNTLRPAQQALVDDVNAYADKLGKAMAEKDKVADLVSEGLIGSCLRAVDAAEKSQVPGTTPIKAGGKELPLAEIKDKVCLAARKALESAKGAGSEGLSAERATEAKNWDGYTFYGRGKKELTTNADKQKSPVWMFWDEVKGFSSPHWRFYHLKWSGKGFKRTEKTGQGLEPPAKLFN